MTIKLKSLDNHFVQVDIEFAKEYGLNEAILAGKMLRLQDKLTGVTDDKGAKWIRLTLEEWHRELPFLSEMTIRRTIDSLEDKKLFLTTVFSGRSKWYRLNPEYLESNQTVQKEQIDYGNCSKRTDTSVQNEQLPIIHSYNPIKEERKLQRPQVIPAIQVFVQVTGKYCLSRPQMEEVQRRVGNKDNDLTRWWGVVKEWVLRGHKPTNVAGMLEWFDKGIPQYQNGHTPHLKRKNKSSSPSINKQENKPYYDHPNSPP